jgi:hypothetical protein
VGALANIVHNIRRGSSSPPSGRPGRSLTTETDLPHLLRLGMGRPRAYSIFHPNYGFVPVAATPVLDRHGGNSGEANGRNFRRRRSSLPSVSSFTAGFFHSQYRTQTVSRFNQQPFMLSLEVMGPGDSLSTAPSQAVTATAAYSCDRTVAALSLRLENYWR